MSFGSGANWGRIYGYKSWERGGLQRSRVKENLFGDTGGDMEWQREKKNQTEIEMLIN